MATFGCKYPCFVDNTKKSTAGSGVNIGKLVSANLTVNLASGELYADDKLAEQASEFSSGSIAMETDDMTDEIAATVYGATYSSTDKTVTYKAGDSAPEGTLGYYKALMRDGTKLYKAFVYPRVRASLGNDNATTKGSSITFGTTSTTFEVMADSTDVWRITEEFSKEDAAKAYVAEQCKVTTT